MEFIKILENLKKQYANDMIIRKNGTILLHPGKMPRSHHMLFAPLEEELIEEYLVKPYVHEFPEEYIKLLKYSNGANLCTIEIQIGKNKLAHSMLVIYGLPKTSPYERADDMEEPFDLRVEDLARHPNISNQWLKCGSFIKEENLYADIDIFIDTQSGRIYACEKNKEEILEQWGSLDECLCSLLALLQDRKQVYVL